MYKLTTSKNRDIELNVTDPDEINDWPYPTPATRKMLMWSKEQIEDVLKLLKDSK